MRRDAAVIHAEARPDVGFSDADPEGPLGRPQTGLAVSVAGSPPRHGRTARAPPRGPAKGPERIVPPPGRGIGVSPPGPGRSRPASLLRQPHRLTAAAQVQHCAAAAAAAAADKSEIFSD